MIKWNQLKEKDKMNLELLDLLKFLKGRVLKLFLYRIKAKMVLFFTAILKNLLYSLKSIIQILVSWEDFLCYNLSRSIYLH